MKSTTISPPKIYIWFVIIMYLVSFGFLIPTRKDGVAFMVWLITLLIFIVMVVAKVKGKGFFSIKKLKHDTPYNKICSLGLLQSVVFMLGCLAYKFKSMIGNDYGVIFFAVSFIILCLMIYFYFVFLGERGKHFSKLSIAFFRASWVIISIGSYAFSRSIFMNASDIPYGDTVTKTSVVGYAILLYSMIYIFLSIFFIIFLGVHHKVVKRRGGRKKTYSSSLVFVPAICMWIVVEAFFNAQVFNSMRFIFNVTIPLDSRDTFFCNKKYMRLSLIPTARYIKVGESDYRVALPHNYEYNFLRLACSEYPPYFNVYPIESSSELSFSGLKNKYYGFIVDVESLRFEHHKNN